MVRMRARLKEFLLMEILESIVNIIVMIDVKSHHILGNSVIFTNEFLQG